MTALGHGVCCWNAISYTRMVPRKPCALLRKELPGVMVGRAALGYQAEISRSVVWQYQIHKRFLVVLWLKVCRLTVTKTSSQPAYRRGQTAPSPLCRDPSVMEALPRQIWRYLTERLCGPRAGSCALHELPKGGGIFQPCFSYMCLLPALILGVSTCKENLVVFPSYTSYHGTFRIGTIHWQLRTRGREGLFGIIVSR